MPAGAQSGSLLLSERRPRGWANLIHQVRHRPGPCLGPSGRRVRDAEPARHLLLGFDRMAAHVASPPVRSRRLLGKALGRHRGALAGTAAAGTPALGPTKTLGCRRSSNGRWRALGVALPDSTALCPRPQRIETPGSAITAKKRSDRAPEPAVSRPDRGARGAALDLPQPSPTRRWVCRPGKPSHSRFNTLARSRSGEAASRDTRPVRGQASQRQYLPSPEPAFEHL
jgi:hypothetical protein